MDFSRMKLGVHSHDYETYWNYNGGLRFILFSPIRCIIIKLYNLPMKSWYEIVHWRYGLIHQQHVLDDGTGLKAVSWNPYPL